MEIGEKYDIFMKAQMGKKDYVPGKNLKKDKVKGEESLNGID